MDAGERIATGASALAMTVVFVTQSADFSAETIEFLLSLRGAKRRGNPFLMLSKNETGQVVRRAANQR